MRTPLLVGLVVAACGNGGSPKAGPGSAPAPTPRAADAKVDCEALPFAESSPVPEASAAAWLTIDGALSLVVTSDSGNRGAYAIVDPETGMTREQGKFPLGDASEDLEGLATRDGKLYGLTSSGWMRVWERTATGFKLVDGPYALGPVDLPDEGSKLGNRPPEGDGMVCGAHASNCGRNYEGLCLANKPTGPCVGFAAAKADGHLYCLAVDPGAAGRLVVRREPAIAVASPGAMADCAFGDDDQLWVGSNLFELSRVYRVLGWQDPKTATVQPFASLGAGFAEVIAARGDVIYRMSDTGGHPSSMAKFRCRTAGR